MIGKIVYFKERQRDRDREKETVSLKYTIFPIKFSNKEITPKVFKRTLRKTEMKIYLS